MHAESWADISKQSRNQHDCMTHGIEEMMLLGKKVVLQYFFKVSDLHIAGRSARKKCLAHVQGQPWNHFSYRELKAIWVWFSRESQESASYDLHTTFLKVPNRQDSIYLLGMLLIYKDYHTLIKYFSSLNCKMFPHHPHSWVVEGYLSCSKHSGR